MATYETGRAVKLCGQQFAPRMKVPREVIEQIPPRNLQAMLATGQLCRRLKKKVKAKPSAGGRPRMRAA